ncbi:MAG: excinuclease ABC subunit UvrA [Candidatus Kapaibacterium sp.]
MNSAEYVSFDESKIGDYTDEISEIRVSGAREHNLKDVELVIPRDKFVVITGLSGSGKSSLAFDTLYAEGQRRYVECMSPYAKQFLGLMKKPDVDIIEGLSPAISIEQKSISHNPRSTVGTTTEVYDYIRLLFSKIGIQHCVDCDIPVIKKSEDQIINEILDKYNDEPILILAPIVKGRKGQYRELLESLLKQGFTKIRLDNFIQTIDSNIKIDRYATHEIDLVIDKLTPTASTENRLRESLNLALNKGEGTAIILRWNDRSNPNSEELYSLFNSCPKCGNSYDKPAPNWFSFNSPYGACKRCSGLGKINKLNSDKLITNENKSLANGAVNALSKNSTQSIWAELDNYSFIKGFKLTIPFKQYPKEIVENILYGDNVEIPQNSQRFHGFKKNNNTVKFKGLVNLFVEAYEDDTLPYNVKKEIGEIMELSECPECQGKKLRKESLAIKIHGINIHQLCSMDIPGTIDTSDLLETKITEREKKIAHLVFKEIKTRLSFLVEVGLSYLSLDRSVRTLSGGESQRIRLASQIGSQLVGIMYVLDEPSIGLHQHDNYKLINSLKKLRDLGNTVIVVEHDKSMIEESDYLVDIGPGAGIHGGEIILTCEPVDLMNKKDKLIGFNNSITAAYLTGEKEIAVPEVRREGNGNYIKLKGAKGNNLKNIDLNLPLGKFICITGMSGSGKSTLINDTLFPILSKKISSVSTLQPLEYTSITGLDYIDKVIEIDQSPIGRTPRSNPATYTNLFTQIRDFFSLLPESRVRGYKPGRFSFNVIGGRCEECQGAGIKKIEMNFLPDVYVKCDVCEGKRYNTETLQVKHNGKSIADVLDMTVEEANEFYKDIPKISKKISTLYEVGLGYIKLGQQAPTLSGGEAQRVKLATELSRVSTGKTIYLLDEPTTGLHFEDINLLLKLLYKLVDKGNTVVVIEHNLDVIKCADYIVDLGPEGGSRGGYIVAEGTPEEIAMSDNSLTGKYLKDELKNLSKSDKKKRKTNKKNKV